MIALAQRRPFHGACFDGRTYDTGSKLGFLTANVAFGLTRTDIKDSFKAELIKLLGE